METGNYTCGHAGPVPPHMGRGKARQSRIAKHFAHRCPTCAAEHIRQYASTLTYVDGRPLSTEDRESWIAKHSH